MAIDEQRVEEFEKKYKETLFSKIGEVRSKQFESISLMKTNARNMGEQNVDIPNASTTVNNKLVELSQEFKRAGISMFSSRLEDYDVVSTSFLGDAIIQDLIDKLAESSDKLGEYSQTMGSVSKKKNEQVQALQNISPIRKFFARIRALFVPLEPVDVSLTEEEQNTLDTPLQKYRDIDNEIWNYNLEENLIPALVKAIAGPQKFGQFDIKHRYDAFTVPGLLEESVIPDLKKLGLEHLVPKLQEALIEEYKKDLPDPELYKVEDKDMHLYIPDFSREPEKPHKVTEEDLKNLHQQAKQVIRDSKKTLRSIKKDMALGGLGLKSFEGLDLTASATQRKDATSVISTELSSEKDDKSQPIQDNSEITID